MHAMELLHTINLCLTNIFLNLTKNCWQSPKDPVYKVITILFER
jgi:hypothetical protein